MIRIALSLLLAGAPLASGFHPATAMTRARGSSSTIFLHSSQAPSLVEDASETVNISGAAPAQPAMVVSSVDRYDDDHDDDNDNDNESSNDNITFNDIARRAINCLIQSDVHKDAVGEPEGTTQASSGPEWIHDESASALQKTLDKLCLKLAADRSGFDRDEASTWIRWIKSTPTPLIVDLSTDFRTAAQQEDSIPDDKAFKQIGGAATTATATPTPTRQEFLSRLGCRLICLPSGATLTEPFAEPPSSLVYGKLLYGGVTRHRTMSSSNSNRPLRRAAERTECKASVRDNVPAWMMCGGPERTYEAVDMGAAAVLEIVLLPQGESLPDALGSDDMTLSRISWKPQKMFAYVKEDDSSSSSTNDDTALLGSVASALSGKSRNEAFKADFQSSVGGLQPQIDSIVRRVLDGRVIRPAHVVDNKSADAEDDTTSALATASADAEELALLGLTPVRGLLLYGPPGCGKTALAREISRALQARAPKIVSAPELLDRWVGGSERLVRELFMDAEAELAACNGDASKSALHVVVIDEIDAVFRKRSGGEDSGEATRASAVNQILAKLDGVNAIPNVLLIGMTNRRELLDEALLRPGRLEVQVEIPLPDKEGRREILRIHFKALRERGRLSAPLCCAIEGVDGSARFDEKGKLLAASETSKAGSLRRMVRRMLPDAIKPTYDLAAATAGFSGADIAGLVRCAGSLALSRARRDGSGVEGLLITLEDVKLALKEVEK